MKDIVKNLLQLLLAFYLVGCETVEWVKKQETRPQSGVIEYQKTNFMNFEEENLKKAMYEIEKFCGPKFTITKHLKNQKEKVGSKKKIDPINRIFVICSPPTLSDQKTIPSKKNPSKPSREKFSGSYEVYLERTPIAQIQKEARRKKLTAILALGRAYERGFKIERSYHRAKVYYTQAAAMGSHEAYFALGWLFEWGIGIKKDWQTAQGLYRKSHRLGNQHAASRAKKLHSFSKKSKATQQQKSRTCVSGVNTCVDSTATGH